MRSGRQDAGGDVAFELPFGEGALRGVLPEVSLAGIREPRAAEGLRDPAARLRERLEAPSGAPPLRELARGARRVLLLCDDATRPTPTALLLPPLLRALEEAGVGEESLRVLFATGSHRPVTAEEARRKLGEGPAARIPWESHDWRGPLIRRGTTSRGTPVEVNPRLGEADLILGIGCVLPHRYCGWSGGGKIVLPGVSGEAGIVRTHRMLAEDPAILLGSGANAALEENREAARAAGLRFLVQAVCDGGGRVAELCAGEPAAAQEAAIREAERLLGVPCPEAEVVVAGAWPEDSDLWQAGKALYAAERVVRPGGLIILVAALPEGFGPHRAYREGFRLSCEQIRDIMERAASEDLLGLAGAFATARVRERARIRIVADGPGRAALRGAGLRPLGDLRAALDEARREAPRGRFLVLREAPLLLPLLSSPPEGGLP